MSDVAPYLFSMLEWIHDRCDFMSMPKYSSCYIAAWAVEDYRNKELTNRGELLIEGRDYFFETKDLLDYLRQFGAKFNEFGVSVIHTFVLLIV